MKSKLGNTTRKGVRARKIYDYLYTEDKLQGLYKAAEGSTHKSVTFKTFAVFAVMLGVAIGLFIARVGPAASEFHEGLIEVVLPEDTHVCSADRIEDGAIRLLEAWITVVEKLIAWQEHDGPELTQADHELGYALTSMGICGTFNQSYDVSILIAADGYILFRFDPKLDFGTGT